MNPSNAQLAEKLFDLALEKPPGEERSRFLDEACAGNPALRARLEALLASEAANSRFLPAPPPSAAGADPDPSSVAEGPTCDATAASHPGIGEQPSQTIGRYKLLERIGEGGFGEVWMAEQREPVKRRVALKLLKLGMDTRQVVARFEAERQALALMDHENIARVFDGGATETGRPYFVMELVRGKRITEYCDLHTLSPRQRIELFIQVCHAIQHAHQKGVIHRDIKPGNVLIAVQNEKPVVKVIDFGIAKATQQELTDKTAFTQFQQFLGTPAYMSPEQAGGGTLDIDTRADIYSLGVLLYELITGRPPLDFKSLTSGGYEEMRRQIKEVEPQKPSTRISTLQADSLTTVARQRACDPRRLSRHVRGDLDRVVLKALEKDRTRRYETAVAFAEDLQRVLDNEPVTAVAPTVSYLMARYVRRHRIPLAFAFGIIALLVTTATYSFAQSVKARRAAEAAKEAEKLATLNLGTAEQERDRARNYATQVDGLNTTLKASTARAQFRSGVNALDAGETSHGIALLARALRTDPGYRPAATRLISTLTERGLALNDHPPLTHDQPVGDHRLDPGSGLLVTRDYDFNIRAWDAPRGELLLETRTLTNWTMPDFAPDGRRLLVVQTNGTAVVYDPLVRSNTPLATLRPTGRVLRAVFLPGPTNRLVAATRGDDGTIQLWNAETGTTLGEPLHGSGTHDGLLSGTRDGKRLVGSFPDGRVGVWPVPPETFAPSVLETAPGSIQRLTPDDRTLVERAADGRSLRFWDIASGQPRGEPVRFEKALVGLPVAPGENRARFWHAHDFEFSEDGRWMLANRHAVFYQYDDRILMPDFELTLLDTRTGRRVQSLVETNVTFHTENLSAGLAALVINTNRLVIRRLQSGTTLVDHTWPTERISTTTFSPAGDRILLGFTDRRMAMLDARTGESLTVQGEQAIISHVGGGDGRAPHQTFPMRSQETIHRFQFSPQGDVFVVHSGNEVLQLWNAFDGRPLSEPMNDYGGRLVQFSSDGRWFLTAKYRNDGRESVPKAGSLRVVPRDHSPARHPRLPIDDAFPALAISADGRWALAGRESPAVVDAQTGQIVHRLDLGGGEVARGWNGIPWLITEAWFSPVGHRIVAVVKHPQGEAGDSMRVFDAASGTLVRNVPIAGLNMARFAGPDRVLTVANDPASRHRITVWDIATGQALMERPSPGDFNVMDVTPDGRRVAFCLTADGIALWDVATLQPVAPLLKHRRHPIFMYSVATSSDSRHLLTAAVDNWVRIWNTETGELEAEVDHGDLARWADFSPDSRLVATCGTGIYDTRSRARIWDFAHPTEKLRAGSIFHPNTIYHSRFTADNQALLAGDRAGTVQLWDLDTGLPMIEPVRLSNPVIRVAVTPQMNRLYAVAQSGSRPETRPLPPAGVAVPDWLPGLAEAAVGTRINDRYGPVPVGPAALRDMKRFVRELPPASGPAAFYTEWAQWFLGDHATRTVAPLSAKTVPAEVEELVATGALTSLREALHIAPTSPRVLASLARRMFDLDEALHLPRCDPDWTDPSEFYARLATLAAPQTVEFPCLLAEIQAGLGKLEAAERTLEVPGRTEPTAPSVLAARATLARARGQSAEAKTLLRRALASPALTHAQPPPLLAPHRLATDPDLHAEASLRNRTALGLAGRPHALPAQCLDLTPFYQRPPDPQVLARTSPAPDLPEGIRTLDRVPFDIRGALLLTASVTDGNAPARLSALPVRQRATRLHFLGRPQELRLTVHYADGQSREDLVPFRGKGNNDVVAIWDNPRPEALVEAIDLTAPNGQSALLHGITVQTHSQPVLRSQPRAVLTQPGGTAEFSADVVTPGEWRFQWSSDGKALPGETNRILRIAASPGRDRRLFSVAIRPRDPDPALPIYRSRPAWIVDPANSVLQGELLEEVWQLVSANSLEAFLASPHAEREPDTVGIVNSFEGAPVLGERFVRRLTGWIIPRETAEYIFHISSDDDSRLSLSPDASPASLAVIAALPGHIGRRRWPEIPPSAVSKPVRLSAGQRYFVEALHREGDGDDHVAVAWRKVGELPPRAGDPPIPGEFLARPAE